MAGGEHREDVQEIGAAEWVEDGGAVGVHGIKLGIGPLGHAGGVSGAVFLPAFVLVFGEGLPGGRGSQGSEVAVLAGLLATEKQGDVLGIGGIGGGGGL